MKIVNLRLDAKLEKLPALKTKYHRFKITHIFKKELTKNTNTKKHT